MIEPGEKFVIDGVHWAVCDTVTVPLAPLPLSEIEKKAIDSAILQMARKIRRENFRIEKIADLDKNERVCRIVDQIISSSLISLRTDVVDEPAEKVFDRLACPSMEWGDDSYAVGLIFYRLEDTMHAMVSYKGRFRGKDLKHVRHSKEDAFQVLKRRGLTRR